MIAYRPQNHPMWSTMSQDLPEDRLQEITNRLQSSRAVVSTQNIAMWKPSSGQPRLHHEENTFLPEQSEDRTWVPTLDKLRFVREALQLLRETLESQEAATMRAHFQHYRSEAEHVAIASMVNRLYGLSQKSAGGPGQASEGHRAVSPYRETLDASHANVIPNILDLSLRAPTAYHMSNDEIRICRHVERNQSMTFSMSGRTCLFAWGHLQAAYVSFDVLLRRWQQEEGQGQSARRGSENNDYELFIITSPLA